SDRVASSQGAAGRLTRALAARAGAVLRWIAGLLRALTVTPSWWPSSVPWPHGLVSRRVRQRPHLGVEGHRARLRHRPRRVRRVVRTAGARRSRAGRPADVAALPRLPVEPEPGSAVGGPQGLVAAA